MAEAILQSYRTNRKGEIMRLLNKNTIKRYYHEHGKRLSMEALEVLEIKLMSLMDRSIRASNNHKTVKAADISIFGITAQI